MNQRIKQLAEHAGAIEAKNITNIPRALSLNGEEIEKFAELLVQKFDNILLLQQLDCIGNKDKKSAIVIEKIRLDTKTYFGVEE